MLTKEEIEEFKKITFEMKGIRLTDEQALDQGLRLVILFDLLGKYGQISKNIKVASSKAEEQNKL